MKGNPYHEFVRVDWLSVSLTSYGEKAMARIRLLTVISIVLGLMAGGCDRGSQSVSEPLDADLPPPAETGPTEATSEPPPPPPEAFLARLPPEEASQLRNLGVEVIVPGNVPPSFSLATLRTEDQEFSTGYILVYQDAANRCFAVEFASGGLGDPPATQNRLPIQAPLFEGEGYGLNYGLFQEASLQQEFPEGNLFTDWLMRDSGGYRLVGASYVGELFEELAGCTDVAPEEAVTIVESFAVLEPENIGDGEGVTE
jgi:hypothetical protein